MKEVTTEYIKTTERIDVKPFLIDVLIYADPVTKEEVFRMYKDWIMGTVMLSKGNKCRCVSKPFEFSIYV